MFLGSGSAGNSTAISCGETLILVDCGFSARETASRMRAAGLDPARVSAVFVTHEHSDHVRGIDVFVRRCAPGCVVYATPGTLRSAPLRACRVETSALRPGASDAVADLTVTSFRTSHDATEPVGFRIEGGGETLGLVTDTGVVGHEAACALQGVDVLGLEVNHDLHMLQHGPYPYHLKRRIVSARGHLSNADAAAALERLASDRLKRVIALHRSRTNNTAELAEAAVRERLERMGHPARVDVAYQDGAIDTAQSPATDDARHT